VTDTLAKLESKLEGYKVTVNRQNYLAVDDFTNVNVDGPCHGTSAGGRRLHSQIYSICHMVASSLASSGMGNVDKVTVKNVSMSCR